MHRPPQSVNSFTFHKKMICSEAQLTNVLMDFWLAGMETTATTLKWAIVLLVAHPEIQAKVQAEIDAVIGRDRSPNMSDKPNMPYTSAFVMELQRRSNIATFNVTHKTTQDTDIGGTHFFYQKYSIYNSS